MTSTTRTVAAIDAEIAEIEDKRSALATRMTALKRERKTAVEAERVQRERDLGAALLEHAGDRAAFMKAAAALYAGVAENGAPVAQDGPERVAENDAA